MYLITPFIHLAKVLRQVIFSASLITFLLITSCSDKETDSSISTLDSEKTNVITVYSSRAEYLIKPLFDRFTEETGIPVRYVTDGEAALIARLGAEQERTPADLFLTVDAGNLWYAESKGLLRPVQSDILTGNIPSHLRSSNNSWFGLSIRARTIIYSTDRTSVSELSTYESLADEAWYGRLCLRTSKKVYNQSLVASVIAAKGFEYTEEMVSGWVNNLAVDPFANDNLAMQAVIAGVCDATLVNTYYYGRLMEEDSSTALGIFWPNQNDRGVHVNISGIAMTQHAKQPDLALQLMEWLSSESAQTDFAGLNKEYPVNPNVKPVDEVAAWGEFKADLIDVERVGELQVEAIKLMDRVGYR